MWRDLPARPFVRFLLVGGFAAGVNVGSRVLLGAVMPYGWSVVAAYGIGMLTAWALSRALVFGRSGDHPARELSRFALVNLVAVAQVWAISVGLRDHAFPAIGFAWHADTVAHLIGVAAPILTSFVGHARFTFARRGPDQSADTGRPSARP